MHSVSLSLVLHDIAPLNPFYGLSGFNRTYDACMLPETLIYFLTSFNIPYLLSPGVCWQSPWVWWEWSWASSLPAPCVRPTGQNAHYLVGWSAPAPPPTVGYWRRRPMEWGMYCNSFLHSTIICYYSYGSHDLKCKTTAKVTVIGVFVYALSMFHEVCQNFQYEYQSWQSHGGRKPSPFWNFITLQTHFQPLLILVVLYKLNKGCSDPLGSLLQVT